MKNKQFLGTIMAMFSSILIGTASITASAVGTYDVEKDIWKFRNTSYSFGNSYVITEQDGVTFRENLSNVDRRLANNLIGSSFLGSCYGMSATSILASQGLIDYSTYTENTDSLYSMSDVDEADDKPSDEILSLINYYACLQFTEEVRQYAAYSMLEQTEADRLNQIIENVENGIPTLVCYFGEKYDSGEPFGHAVVAYDVEYGEYKSEYSNKNYTGRILIYDCNNVAEKCYIYFNEEYSWETDYCSSDNNGNINLVISDIDLLNNNGLLGGTEPYINDRDFMPLLSVKSLLTDKTVQKISFDNGSWTAMDSIEGQINEFPAFLGDVPQIDSSTYILKDADSGYVLSTQGIGTMSAQMNYQNSLFIADVSEGNQIVFHPSGYIEVSGNNTPFNLEMAFNDGNYIGDWYNLTVSGAADYVSLMQTNEGFILKSDYLNDTIITVNDGKGIKSRVLSLDLDIDSIMIFETDNQNIGFSADLDNNGSYETVLHDIADGDVNSNGVLSVSDVVLLQKWLLSVPDTHLVNWEAADMDYNNRLDVFDLCLMKKALVSMKNEEPPPFDENKNSFHVTLGIVEDETYNNISATSLESVYSTDAKELICELKNSNLGKGFYYFPIPFLEKYKNGNWEQVYNGDPSISYQYYDGYALCGLAYFVTDKEFSTRVTIQTKNLTGLTEGHYRFKIYTAKNILYAEFDVISAN